MKPHKIIIVVPPGIEDLAKAECHELGLTDVESHPGWLVVHGHDRIIHRLNNLARLPSRILVELASFRATSFSEFETRLGKLKLRSLFGGRSLAFSISVRHCKLYHTGAIEERLLRWLGDKGSRPMEGELKIFVRGEDDRFSLSLDSSGEHLHRRGIAIHRGEAPLRENLAAALLRRASPEGAIWDPTCGSGTILLESILADTKTPLSKFRKFAFESWPSHDAKRYEATLSEMESSILPMSRRLIASDIEEKELEAFRNNLSRVGWEKLVEVFSGDVTKLSPTEVLPSGSVISNPPYGQRVSPGEGVWKNLAAWANSHAGLDVHMVLPRGLSMNGFQKGLRFRNGGLGVSTYHSMKKS